MSKGLLAAAIAFTIGMTVHALVFETQPTELACDSLEHARIKIALAECSDAAMMCAWGEEYKEATTEE